MRRPSCIRNLFRNKSKFGLFIDKKMAFGFPAHHSDTRLFGLAEAELSTVIETAFSNLGWQYKTLPNNEFQASVAVNFSSWGEKLKVSMLAGGIVQAESKCMYPLQCFDWGKNKENVERLFAEIERLKETNSPVMSPAFNEKGQSRIERVFDDEETD